MAERNPCKELHDQFQDLNGLAGQAEVAARLAEISQQSNVGELKQESLRQRTIANAKHKEYEDCVSKHGTF